MIHELENLQGAPGTKRAGARRRIVDELGALQMDATRAEIADFESGFAAQALLDRRAPLLDILCGSMGSKAVKLTVVEPRTAGLKLREDWAWAAFSKEAGGLKLSNCWVSGKTKGMLWR